MADARPTNDLARALGAMTWAIEPGSFALAGFEGRPAAAELARLRPPAQVVLTDGGTTVLGPADVVAAIAAARPGARLERDLSWIRFDAPMGWGLVGFLALVTGALARAGVPLGAVCAYDRDHLFVARRHLAAARAALAELFPERTGAD